MVSIVDKRALDDTLVSMVVRRITPPMQCCNAKIRDIGIIKKWQLSRDIVSASRAIDFIDSRQYRCVGRFGGLCRLDVITKS
jgi:hypothetical protein